MLTIIQQLCSRKQKHTKYTQINTNKSIYVHWNGPSVTKPNPENCKNCSSKCAYDCAPTNSSQCFNHKSQDSNSKLTILTIIDWWLQYLSASYFTLSLLARDYLYLTFEFWSNVCQLLVYALLFSLPALACNDKICHNIQIWLLHINCMAGWANSIAGQKLSVYCRCLWFSPRADTAWL